MAHQRKTIRQAVQTLLIAANTAAGSRVDASRMGPQREAELPVIAVYTDSETIEDVSELTTPRQLTRKLQLAVEGWVALETDEDVDDALDDLAEEVERAMHADPTFGDTCNNATLTTTDVAIRMEGKRPMGAIRLIFDVRYFTGAPEAADVTLPDFTTADIQYDLANAQEVEDQAHDTVESIDEA